MKKGQIIYFFPVILVQFLLVPDVQAEPCPEKIKWKKLRTEEEVKTVLYRCLPVNTVKTEIIDFLSGQKIEYTETEKDVIFFSVLTKSRSIWIEKKWAVRFVLDETQKLKTIEVEQWLTGP